MRYEMRTGTGWRENEHETRERTEGLFFCSFVFLFGTDNGSGLPGEFHKPFRRDIQRRFFFLCEEFGEYYVFPDDGLLYGFGLAGERFGSAHSPCACGGRFCLVRVFSVPFFQLFFTVFTAFPFQFGVVFSGGVHAFGVQSSNIQDDLFMNKFRNITIAKWACTVRSFHNRFFWV